VRVSGAMDTGGGSRARGRLAVRPLAGAAAAPFFGAATLFRLVVLFGAVVLSPVAAVAQSGPSSQAAPAADTGQSAVAEASLRARQAQLLAAMLADPADLDIAFDYATVSTRLGDYEAAIATFERMLIYAPGLPRIQLELGVLYFRLGSTEVARSYFEQALAAPDVPPEVAARVETFLAAIETQEARGKLSATLVTGLRYQSNANAGPGSRQVTLNGLPFLLDDTAIGQPDWNAFVAGNVHAAYDLGTQGDLLEADLLFYGGRYLDTQRLDTGLAELTLGPSFNMGRFGIDDAQLGVYAILAGVRLNDGNYSGALGAGARIVHQPSPLSSINARIEYRHRWFRDTATYPTVSNRNGYQLLGQLTYSHRIDANWVVRALTLGDFEQAAANFEQSVEGGAGLGATYRFASPVARLEIPWALDADVGYIRRQYRAPDPAVDPATAQHDNEFWLRGGLTVPLRADLAAAITTEFRRLQSNYATRDFSNASVTVSLIMAF